MVPGKRSRLGARLTIASQEQVASRTLSGGVMLKGSSTEDFAAFNGYPDYECIVKDADDALYRAKKVRRNRCELAA
jgi:diguanylate cyclase